MMKKVKKGMKLIETKRSFIHTNYFVVSDSDNSINRLSRQNRKISKNNPLNEGESYNNIFYLYQLTTYFRF